jgi:hypothetical protein
MTVSQSSTSTPVTGHALVAGVAVRAHSERDADAAALALGARLTSSGLVGVQVGTHWVGSVQDPGGRQLALSVLLPTVPFDSADGEDDAWRALVEAVPGAGAQAIAVGDRRSGDTGSLDAADQAVAERMLGAGGRAVWFEGVDRLVGTVGIGDLLTWTPVERVRVLGGGAATSFDLLVTRDFVRPRWESGSLVLAVQHNVGGTLVPFEVPDPTPCCVEH